MRKLSAAAGVAHGFGAAGRYRQGGRMHSLIHLLLEFSCLCQEPPSQRRQSRATRPQAASNSAVAAPTIWVALVYLVMSAGVPHPDQRWGKNLSELLGRSITITISVFYF